MKTKLNIILWFLAVISIFSAIVLNVWPELIMGEKKIDKGHSNPLLVEFKAEIAQRGCREPSFLSNMWMQTKDLSTMVTLTLPDPDANSFYAIRHELSKVNHKTRTVPGIIKINDRIYFTSRFGDVYYTVSSYYKELLIYFADSHPCLINKTILEDLLNTHLDAKIEGSEPNAASQREQFTDE